VISLGALRRHWSVEDFTVELDRRVIGRCLEHARGEKGAKKGQYTLYPPGLAHYNHDLWMARCRANRLSHVAALHSPSSFLSPVSHHFDSIGQTKPLQYRATSSFKRCCCWKNDRSAHNNDQEERKTPTDVCFPKHPENITDVGGIEWYMRKLEQDTQN
jgi:hypothetical protein